DVVEAEFHDPLLLVIDAVPRAVSAVVGELERDVEVLALEQPDDLLEVVALLAGDAKLVALDLRFDALGALVADDLADLLRVLGADALLEGHVDLALLARLARLGGLHGLEGDAAFDELVLEHIEGGLDAVLG